MEVESFAAISRKDLIYLFPFDRKLKFVRLDASGCVAAKTFLYQFAFIGFEHISFSHCVIKMPGFNAFAKNKKIFEIYKYDEGKENEQEEDTKELSEFGRPAFKSNACNIRWLI
jgi:hypothetical protein